jgi:diguanylate cyclase (GGDEF)-like protein
MQWDIWILPLAANTVIASITAINARRLGGTTLVARASVAVMVGLGVWTAAYTMQWATATLGAQLFWDKAIYLGVVVVPASFFVLALALSGHEDWLTRRRLALLAVEPVLCLVWAWANPHGLFIQKPSLSAHPPFAFRWQEGPLFLIHATYSYALLTAGLVLLVQAWRTAAGLFRRQISMILLATTIPSVASVVNVANLHYHPGSFDPTPIAFTVTGVAVVWALFRHDLLMLVPIARNVLVDTMSDALVVIDVNGRIVDLNPAAHTLLQSVEPDLPSELVGEPATRAFASWPEQLLASRQRAFQVSVPINGEVGHFDARLTQLRDSKRRPTGELLLLRDEAELVRAQQEVETANQALRDQLETITKLHIELEQLAVRDPLTGLLNRRYMEEMLEREIARGCREGYCVRVALLDVDSFKSVNDTLGHGVGDRLLASVGEILLTQTRVSDACFRYGGDEFLVVMPNITAEDAARRAQEWRTSCSLLRPSGDEQGRVVTMSIGIATAPQDGTDAAALGAAVDAALYLAKRSGRDRTVIHDPKTLTLAG